MKIGFCGTISVGKTTLVNALKELPEFAHYEFRTERSKYLRDLGIPLNTDSTLKGQFIFMAERSSELYLDNMITDRTIIDVMAFTRLANSIPYFMADALNDAAAPLLREYDYIFYVSPEGVELEDNGVRAVDVQYRIEIDQEIIKLLEKHQTKIPHLATLSGTTEERIQKIKQVMSF
jgi:nicotinamide riboside kinase